LPKGLKNEIELYPSILEPVSISIVFIVLNPYIKVNKKWGFRRLPKVDIKESVFILNSQDFKIIMIKLTGIH